MLLLDAANSLIGANGAQVPDALKTGLLATAEGRKTFGYAVKCALPGGFSVLDDLKSYPGEGLLGTTGSWSASGLLVPQQNDLFACMIAHLNPSMEHVWIQLTGESVPLQPGDQSEYSFNEAVWISRFNTGTSSLEFHVWPLKDLQKLCGRGVDGSLQTRVCGEGIAGCGLIVEHDLATACTLSAADDYTCLGQPAIRTRLKPGDVSKAHGGCGL